MRAYRRSAACRRPARPDNRLVRIPGLDRVHHCPSSSTAWPRPDVTRAPSGRAASVSGALLPALPGSMGRPCLASPLVTNLAAGRWRQAEVGSVTWPRQRRSATGSADNPAVRMQHLDLRDATKDCRFGTSHHRGDRYSTSPQRDQRRRAPPPDGHLLYTLSVNAKEVPGANADNFA